MTRLSNGVVVRTNPRGLIGWASDWAKLVRDAPEMPEVEVRFYPALYGHTDYYLREGEERDE